MTRLYLASGSPRRRELLTQIGVPFVTLSCPIDENRLPAEPPADYVARLARAKALAGLAAVDPEPGAVVLGADTSVVLDGHILGKPDNRDEALAMLAALSGREHEVLTAVALASMSRVEVRVVCSRVGFRPLAPGEAEAYWASGEPRDKAGGYGIQGLAAVFVRQLHGSYSGVVGLPLCETAELLANFGIPCWQRLSETHP